MRNEVDVAEGHAAAVDFELPAVAIDLRGERAIRGGARNGDCRIEFGRKIELPAAAGNIAHAQRSARDVDWLLRVKLAHALSAGRKRDRAGAILKLPPVERVRQPRGRSR